MSWHYLHLAGPMRLGFGSRIFGSFTHFQVEVNLPATTPVTDLTPPSISSFLIHTANEYISTNIFCGLRYLHPCPAEDVVNVTALLFRVFINSQEWSSPIAAFWHGFCLVPHHWSIRPVSMPLLLCGLSRKPEPFPADHGAKGRVTHWAGCQSITGQHREEPPFTHWLTPRENVWSTHTRLDCLVSHLGAICLWKQLTLQEGALIIDYNLCS